MVSGPNRPTNIKNMITRLPASDNSPVKPRDNPTVPKADIASKIISINAAFFVIDKINIENNSNSVSLNNLSILFTGTLQNLSRERAKALAKSKGFKIASSVTNKLDYLVMGEKSGSKLKKAQELNTKIISEEEFLNLINE